MNTNILIEDTDEIQQEIDIDTDTYNDDVKTSNNDDVKTSKPQMLEVVCKDFQGKQLIID
jgi:hypothetical protein